MEKTNGKHLEYMISKNLNGWTWGTLNIDNTSLKMISQEKELFSISGNQISGLTNPNRLELAMEFNPPDDFQEEYFFNLEKIFYVKLDFMFQLNMVKMKMLKIQKKKLKLNLKKQTATIVIKLIIQKCLKKRLVKL